MPKPKKTIDPERGRRLKECLIAAGVSVPSFAASLGMAEGSVRNIISGQRSLTDDIAIRAADLLGVRAAWLLNLDDFQTEDAIRRHPAFPFMAALVSAVEREKAREKFLASFHVSVAPNTTEYADATEREVLDHLEDILARSDLMLVQDDRGAELARCSLAEVRAFYADIDDYTEFAIGKLLDGRYTKR